MAMTTLNLDKNIWQEIGAIGFVGDKSPASAMFEITLAGSLPVGDVADSMLQEQKEKLYYPADKAGDAFYVRCITDEKSAVTFYEA